jgi:zinc protease
MEQQGMVRIYFGGENPEIKGDVLTEQKLILAMTNLVGMRLRDQIREKMGASYGFSVYCDQRNYPTRRYDAQILFGCNSARAKELAGAVIDELCALADSPVFDTDLIKLREAFIRKRETDLKTNDFWQGVLTANYKRGEESAQYGDTERVLAGLNTETMQKLIGRYFNRDNYVTWYLLPSSTNKKRT